MYNKISIIGFISSDIRITTVNGRDGTPVKVCNFNVATNDRRQGTLTDGTIRPQFFRVGVWGKMSDACEKYLSKGRLVQVEGTLSASLSVGSDNRTYLNLDIKNPEITFMPETVRHTEGNPTEAPSQSVQSTPAVAPTPVPAATPAPQTAPLTPEEVMELVF